MEVVKHYSKDKKFTPSPFPKVLSALVASLRLKCDTFVYSKEDSMSTKFIQMRILR